MPPATVWGGDKHTCRQHETTKAAALSLSLSLAFPTRFRLLVSVGLGCLQIDETYPACMSYAQ